MVFLSILHWDHNPTLRGDGNGRHTLPHACYTHQVICITHHVPQGQRAPSEMSWASAQWRRSTALPRRRLESLWYIESAVTGFSISALPVYVIQHPDTPGSLRQSQRQAVLGERKRGQLDLGRNHQAGSIKSSHLEGLTHRASLGGVEPYSPHVEETRAAGNEIDRLSIRSPAGFVVPVPTISDASPRATRLGRHI